MSLASSMSGRPVAAEDLDHVLGATAQLWKPMAGSRIFLTGGTGFFGAWLVESFAYANARLALGAELVVLSRDPAAVVRRLPLFAALPGVTLHAGDVRTFEYPAGRFDVVVHGAAESSAQPHAGDEQYMFDTIVDGTRRMLGLAESSGARAFLLLSSGAVYGRQPADVPRLDEAFPGGPSLADPRSAYAEAKRCAEILAAIAAARSSLSVRVARCFAFVGPHLPLDAHFAIGNFIRDAMAGGPIRIRGDGTAVRSYLYMADLATWLWTLALSESATGAYNVGSEESLSILDTARLVALVCAPDAEIVIEGRPTPGASVHRYVPSTRRAETELGLRQRVGVADAVRRTSHWYASAAPAGSRTSSA